MYFSLILTKVYCKNLNILNLRNTHEKKSWTHEMPTGKKKWNTRNLHEKIVRTHEGTMAQWYKTHETHDGTILTEFSILR